MIKLITRRPVIRDEQGFYCHPDLPQWGEAKANFDKWIADQHLQFKVSHMEDEITAEQYDATFDDPPGYEACKWQPASPNGSGWWIAAIYDTETWGPCCLWLRNTPPWSSMPTSQGWYLHKSDDEDEGTPPTPISVLWSGTANKFFVSSGQLGITIPISCEEYGGLWAPLILANEAWTKVTDLLCQLEELKSTTLASLSSAESDARTTRACFEEILIKARREGYKCAAETLEQSGEFFISDHDIDAAVAVYGGDYQTMDDAYAAKKGGAA